MKLSAPAGRRLLAVILLASCHLCSVAGAPARATDNYVSVCPFVVNPNADLPWEDLTPLPTTVPIFRPPPSPPPPSHSSSSCPEINTHCGGIVPDFIYEPSAAYSGFDSLGATSSSTSAATCGTLCLSKAGCVGFVHNVSSGICSFRTYLASGVAKTGIDTWRRCNVPPPPPVKPATSTSSPTQAVCGAKLPGYTWKPYQNMQGFDSPLGKSGVVSNITICATMCNAMSECVAFTYDLTSKNCYYKSGLGPLVTLNRVDTYVKCEGPITTQTGPRRRLLAVAALPRWSNPATWPNGVVPGIGAAVGANATIPCGKTVLLDVPDLTLDVLRIQGLLKFWDDPSLPSIYVRANFVLVEGQLFIGTPKQQFRHKATIELTPNTRNGRAHLLFSSTPPADAANPRSLGHKAFVVVGGQVHLHGLPGPASMPVWCRLSKTAVDEDTTITVDADVEGSWPVGAEIVVASSDYDMAQAEPFTITSVKKAGSGAVIALDKPLKFMHYGKANSLSDGFGGFVDERAEVALLSRNIVITGTEEPAPYQYEGGHFMVFMTPTPQYIEGVEFYKLGQQGSLGRYSIHFHINGNTPKTVCRKNSIHQSKQRCIVVHASHNMTIEKNVAFNTAGHCFMLEEGGETGNTFLSNLGILAKAVDRRIKNSQESDDRPATFWIGNPQNSFLNNVAAGSEDSGFWIELMDTVRGASLDIPGLNETNPFHTSLGTFSGNVAHSNAQAGFRTYPNGIRPRATADWDAKGKPGVLSGFNLYKNAWMGMFIHNSDYLTVTKSTFADNLWGLFLNQDNAIALTDSRVVAFTNNFGTPEDCGSDELWANCRPVYGCRIPLKWGAQGRSTGGHIRTAPIFGVLVDMDSRFNSDMQHNGPNKISKTTFAGFNATCWTAAAIAMVSERRSEYWNPGHSIKAVKFSRDSNPVWAPPRKFIYEPWGNEEDGGEASQFYTLWDTDGSITGSPGYVVANNPTILPPKPKTCKFSAKQNAYACPGTCYRTLQVKYNEPGFKGGRGNTKNTHGSFSYLEITRVADGKVLTLDGNLNQQSDFWDGWTPSERFYAFTLLAGQTYKVRVVPSSKAPIFFPSNFKVGYLDYEGCGEGITLQFEPQENRAWAVSTSDVTFFKQCPGTSALPATAQHGPICINKVAWLQLSLGTVLREPVFFKQTTGSTACSVSYQCSAIWSGSSGWAYEASGRELRPEFYNPLTNTASWKQGTAPLGHFGWDDGTIKTTLPVPSPSRLTYYFRKSFTLRDTVCFSALEVEVMVGDGVVVYLNNKEILRANMPSGKIKNSTLASTQITTAPSWRTFTLPLPTASNAYYLVEGANFIAAEQHVYAEWQDEIAFDMRVAGIRKEGSCKGASITPEVCDGVDNNNNGKVDEAADGKPLTQPCSTPCGTGTATCIRGLFQSCTAPPAKTEVCNGKDDNCDGLVDNGPSRLNCAAGKVCSAGKCLAVADASRSVQLWPRNSSGWAYYDKGGNLYASNPTWRTGNNLNTWKRGKGPLGFTLISEHQSWDTFGTVIRNFPEDGKSVTAYFAKSFTLSEQDLKNTFSLDFNVRRADGALIFLNGVELWRTNMPWGAVKWNTVASDGTEDSEWETGSGCCNLQWSYNKCEACFHNTTTPLKVGTNWIAAELHVAWEWKENAAFDMDLYRKAIVPCSSLPGKPAQCARRVHQMISPLGSSWKYSDGSFPLPPSSWMLKNFADSSWKTGKAPLGFGSDSEWLLNTKINSGPNKKVPRRAFYFRRKIQVADGGCYLQLNSTLLATDGAVVYMNGVEAYRYNMPSDPINSNSYASDEGDWEYHSTTLSGGWLQAGTNLIAVELHRGEESIQNIFFDLQLEGPREAITCSPAPP